MRRPPELPGTVAALPLQMCYVRGAPCTATPTRAAPPASSPGAPPRPSIMSRSYDVPTRAPADVPAAIARRDAAAGVAGFLARMRGARASPLDALLADTSRGVSGMLSAIASEEGGGKGVDSRPSFLLHLFGIFYDFIQFYTYAIFPMLGWGKINAVSWLLGFMSFRNPFQLALNLVTAVAPALIAFVWVILAAFVGCVAVTIHGFATGKFGSTLPLRILRATAKFVVVLQITLVERLASVFPCGTVTPGLWSYTTITCTGGLFVLMRLLTAAIIFAFLLFSVVVSAISLNRAYDQGQVSYSRHALGRVEAAMILLRALLSLLFTNASELPLALLLIASVTCGLLFVFMYVRYLPDLDPWRNKLQSCLGAAFAFTALCSIPAVALPPENAGQWRPLLAVAFYCGLPGSVALTYIVVSARLAAAAALPSTAGSGGSDPFPLLLPTDVEVVARCQVASTMETARTSRVAPRGGNGGAGVDDDANSELVDAALTRAAVVLQRGSLRLFQDSALMDCLHANFVRGYPRVAQVVDYAPFLATVWAARAAAGRWRPVRPKGAESRGGSGGGGGGGGGSMDNEAAANSFFAIAAAHSASSRGLVPFPSALAIELTLLHAGLTKPSSVDVRFLLANARQQALLEEHAAAECSGASSQRNINVRQTQQRLTAVQEVQVQQLVHEASVGTLRAMVALARVWSLTAEARPAPSEAVAGRPTPRMEELSLSSGSRAAALTTAVSELAAANRGTLTALAFLQKLAPRVSSTLAARGAYLCGVAGKLRAGAACFAAAAAALALEMRSGDDNAMSADEGASVGTGATFSAAEQRATVRAEVYRLGGGSNGGGGNGLSLPATLTAALSSLPAVLPTGRFGSLSRASSLSSLLTAATAASSAGSGVGREPFYALLRLRIHLVLAVAVLALIAAVGVCQWQMSIVAAISAEVVASGDRQVLLFRMARRVTRGAALAAGALRPAPPNLTFNITLAGLASDAAALTSLHAMLSASARATKSAAEATLYTANDALTLSALSADAVAFAPFTYSASFGDAMMAFASSAAGLAGESGLASPSGNFSLRGVPSAAYFLTTGARDGLLVSGAGSATTFVGARLAAASISATAVLVTALLAVALVPLVAGVTLLLSPTLTVRNGVAKGIASLLALAAPPHAPSRGLAVQAALSRACFARLLTTTSAGDERNDRSLLLLLRTHGGLERGAADVAVAWARGGIEGRMEAGVADVEVDETSPRSSGGASSLTLTSSTALSMRALRPLLLLLAYAAAVLVWSLSEVALANSAGALVAQLGYLRGALLQAPSAAVLAAEIDGMTLELWQTLSASSSSSPPACNVSALTASAAKASEAGVALDALMTAALQPSANLGSDALSSLLLGGVCEHLAANAAAAVPGSGKAAFSSSFVPTPADLGLAPLDCSGSAGVGAPSSGAFFGKGDNGLAGLVRAYASALASQLRERARSVGSGSVERASFLLAGSTVVSPPLTDARGAAWPCAPPLLDAPGLSWQSDASLHQLVEPGVRAAQALALAAQAARLQELLTVQSTAASLMPLLALAAYWLLALPLIKELDELTKMVKTLQERVQAGVID